MGWIARLASAPVVVVVGRPSFSPNGLVMHPRWFATLWFRCTAHGVTTGVSVVADRRWWYVFCLIARGQFLGLDFGFSLG